VCVPTFLASMSPGHRTAGAAVVGARGDADARTGRPDGAFLAFGTLGDDRPGFAEWRLPDKPSMGQRLQGGDAMIGCGFFTAGETPNAPDRHMEHFPITLVATCARNDSARARLHIDRFSDVGRRAYCRIRSPYLPSHPCQRPPALGRPSSRASQLPSLRLSQAGLPPMRHSATLSVRPWSGR